ncbi:mannose-6-phosphate isomerase [Drosophila sulfurigaster albostrigata]|uniref:mannose-6-phosphate isomerase n=1 Tax=Drosophila sulfurigaster albostrigata TaxID=89887 RepID=UPI002D21C25A|nr:mannose-6-phosphate isomerase [Drosophila sulfurigaster albostrigata]XP_062122647.1 mannose-6-phosphate isomerase [Drosophila sulfurigaster albostrigata]XP_062122648.1 mannose-6-phosphate isomerase [Drosophila sulfurigaster albostrigata]
MELTGWVKNYDWGKQGIQSAVAQLAMANDPDFVLNETETYAEMWMGTHFCGVSIVKETGETLDRVLKKDLPYLFKVLSIRKALSIQVHPNKCEAERLHKERPDVYKDDNHKPELSIAITPFLALVGFQPVEDIIDNIDEFQPLTELIGQETVDELHEKRNSETLKNCYEIMMRADDASISKCIKAIAKHNKSELKRNELLDIFNKVNQDFPDDVGVLCLFFLNLVRLQPGQAIYLGANEIHAYLDGECVECMACSDNVIRAGLTPKYKDVEQLISSVIFDGAAADAKLFMPYRIDDTVQVFVPPVDDFAVMHVGIKHSVCSYKLQIQAYGSILLTLAGSRILRLKTDKGVKEITLTRGSIVYIPVEAAPEIEFLQTEDCDEDFTAYIATYNYFRRA